ncbi:MAG: orc1/cdc6 family replication initiation protein [Candidatus Aenigmarchaeota archaeon]|nr:orc1/cdc6 family replication initiation protein [Candidatus Aenigmarchaeota archaeon]
MEIKNIFSQYVQKQSVFTDKRTLSSNFIPDKIQHRDEEIQLLSTIIAPVLKGFNSNNIFIYGTCGTGKTICAKYVLGQLVEILGTHGRDVRPIYINCKMKKVADTEYRLFAQLLKEMGELVPDTGLPTDVLYRKFFGNIDSKKQEIIIVLDEIDTLFKKIGDDFLYNLTRINTELKQSHIMIIGITNDVSFRDNLDTRVKSSLSEEEIIFKPYNASQLKDILTERSLTGFVYGSVGDSALSKCAALAAQEHGDARRALDLLRVAGETADRLGEPIVTEKHVDMAEYKIDTDRMVETVKSQPTQSQVVLYSIIKLHEKAVQQKQWSDKRMLTGDVFDSYGAICTNTGLKPLTQRRISDLIAELDMLGIITAKVISNGRYGRTREISLAINENAMQKISALLNERFGI